MKEKTMKRIKTYNKLLFHDHEAAELLGTATGTLKDLMFESKIPYIRVGNKYLLSSSWLVSKGISLPDIDGCGQLLSPDEACRLLSMTKHELKFYTELGRLPSVMIDENVVRYRLPELRRWIEEMTQAPLPEKAVMTRVREEKTMEQIESTRKLLFNVKEASELLGITVEALWELIREEKVPYVCIGSRCLFSRDWLITKGAPISAAPDNDDLLTPFYVSWLLGVPRWLLKVRTEDGAIPAVMVGKNRFRYNVPELRRWIEEQVKAHPSEKGVL
jgi:predicted site-specific integrase-resolvase